MSKKILIVEDDEVLASTLNDLLSEEAKFDVATANNAEDAQKMAAAVRPDLIILDILMPKVNGMDLLDEWNKEGFIKSIPVIVLSNMDKLDVINRAIELGASSYFLKSEMSTGDIVNHCQQLLDGKIPEPNSDPAT